MNIYSRKQVWKWLLLISAAIIVGASLLYSGFLVSNIAKSEKRNVELWAEAVRRKAVLMEVTGQLYEKIAREERKKMELWAEANRQLAKDLNDYSFIFEVIKGNENVPVMLVDDAGKIISTRNLDSIKGNDPAYLEEQLAIMRDQHDSIAINLGNGRLHFLFYKDSEVFTEIRQSFEDNERSFIREVASNPTSAPAVYADSVTNEIIAFGNFDDQKIHSKDSAAYVQEVYKKMQLSGNKIKVSIGNGRGRGNVIYYMESPYLQQLRFLPLVLLGVVGVFLVVAYLLFSTSRRAEQNLVWVGMAKETAHQLGTPLSALFAWMEYLKMKGVDEGILNEIGHDIKRLEMITERFSKIGSRPKLERTNMVEALDSAVEYMRSRSPKDVTFIIQTNGLQQLPVPVNVPLFAWVIENLCRNAVDAMDGKGSITIELSDHMQTAYIDITDTGKGMPKSKYKTVFEPGYTTKQRGWGLGLSLCKRIIENYHEGKIFVKRSEADKGTTFRIVLKK
ncbi:MAG: integral membrane sensor signal transduction histidine kinase [Bacteroidetes bacterium]|nr:MAG: integral membrane sensor signal transduction histidine kinase [Bacteroidota bacterium]